MRIRIQHFRSVLIRIQFRIRIQRVNQCCGAVNISFSSGSAEP